MGWLPDASTSVRLRYGLPYIRRLSALYEYVAKVGELTITTVWKRAVVSEGRLAAARAMKRPEALKRCDVRAKAIGAIPK